MFAFAFFVLNLLCIVSSDMLLKNFSTCSGSFEVSDNNLNRNAALLEQQRSHTSHAARGTHKGVKLALMNEKFFSSTSFVLQSSSYRFQGGRSYFSISPVCASEYALASEIDTLRR